LIDGLYLTTPTTEHLVVVDSTAMSVFSTVDLEREIKQELLNLSSIRESQPTDFAPPSLRAPALSTMGHLEHRDGATEVGKRSAEAVLREYEAAAKEIEAMGAELIKRVKQCEAMSRDAVAVSEGLNETAERYREEARRIFLEIENYSLVTAEVRRTCAELKRKIAAPANRN
jgi:hypothetical protein